jgi:protein gp37
MSDSSAIEWTDATWNPVTGCTKVSQGCKNCYAERDWARLSANPKSVYYLRKFTDVAVHPARLEAPLRWSKPRRIFVNSMSDLFHEVVPDAFLDKVFAVMALSQSHTFQVLTKRPHRMLKYLSQQPLARRRWEDEVRCMQAGELRGCSPPPVLPNVWLGVSVEDQTTADARIPLLLQTPAAVRWISPPRSPHGNPTSKAVRSPPPSRSPRKPRPVG